MKDKKIIRQGSARLVAVVGPTGSGKTEWTKKLAQKFNAKVISADSRQIYKGMDIGTGKDKTFEQEMIDIIEPDKSYSIADYKKQTEDLINQYLAMNCLPMISGGSMLYVDSVLNNYVIPPLQHESHKIREQLEKLKDSELLSKLKELDEVSANKIDLHNRRRIIRAIEVSLLTKIPFSKQFKKLKPKFKVIIIGIKIDRETLYSKIDARVDKMIKDGLVEEVRNLLKKYSRHDLPAFNTIGYKEIIDYLKGRVTLKEAIAKIKTNTHDYVRRQETWFRRNKDIKWVSKYEQAEKLVEKFLN